MEFRTFTNGLGEKATTDWLRVWRGEDTDETTIRMETLQPVESVLPQCAMTDADAKVSQIARDCILDRAPSIQPEDEDERDAFRRIWDVVSGMKGEYALCVEPLVFSNELGVYARDVVYGVKKEMGMSYVIEFSTTPHLVSNFFLPAGPLHGFGALPKNIEDATSMRASMRLVVLAAGRYAKPIGHSAVYDTSGRSVGLEDMSSAAALMIALRSRTGWYQEWQKTLPF